MRCPTAPSTCDGSGPAWSSTPGDADGHPEFDWVGRRLQVGDAVLDIPAACPRCVMITREVDADTPQDRTILRHVVKDLGQNVGVYATVAAPATIHAGDPVTVLD